MQEKHNEKCAGQENALRLEVSKVSSMFYRSVKEAEELRKKVVRYEEALNRARWDFVSCGILTNRSSGDEAVEELMHYVKQVEEHTIPAIKRIDQALSTEVKA